MKEIFSSGPFKQKDENALQRCWKWKEAILRKIIHFKGSERNWKWLWESKKNNSYRSWTWPFGRTDIFCPVLTTSNPHHLHKKACNESRLPHNTPQERMIPLLSVAYWVTGGYHGSGSLITSNAKHAECEWRLHKGIRERCCRKSNGSLFYSNKTVRLNGEYSKREKKFKKTYLDHIYVKFHKLPKTIKK